jgi:hypothetical protein
MAAMRRAQPGVVGTPRAWTWASEAALGQKGGMRARARVREREAGAGQAVFAEGAEREAPAHLSETNFFLFFKSKFN